MYYLFEFFNSILFIPVIILFFIIRHQGKRIQNLTNKLNAQIGLSQDPIKEVPKTTPTVIIDKVKIDIPALASLPSLPTEPSLNFNDLGLVQWFRHNFLLKLGVFSFLIAVAWMLTYAVGNNWIGQTGQVILGLIAGTMFIMASYYIFNKNPKIGSALTLIGVITNIMSSMVGFRSYGVLPPLTGFVLIIVSIIFGLIVSIKYNSRSLSLGLILASFVTPILVGGTATDLTGLFSYLLILNLATFGIMYLKQWRVIQIVAILSTGFYSLILLGDGQWNNTYWIFLVPMLLMYYLSSIYSISRSSIFRSIDYTNIMLSTLIANFWLLAFASEAFRVPILMLSTVTTFLVALHFNKNTIFKGYAYIQIVSALTTIGIATFVQFYSNLFVFILVFSLEILMYQIFLSKLFKKDRFFNILPFFYIIPVIALGFYTAMSFPSYGRELAAPLITYLYPVLAIAGILILTLLVNIITINKLTKSRFAQKIVSPFIFVLVYILSNITVSSFALLTRDFNFNFTIQLILLIMTALYLVTKVKLISQPNILTKVSLVLNSGILATVLWGTVFSWYDIYYDGILVSLVALIYIGALNFDRFFAKPETKFELLTRNLGNILIYLIFLNGLTISSGVMLLGGTILIGLTLILEKRLNSKNQLETKLNRGFLLAILTQFWIIQYLPDLLNSFESIYLIVFTLLISLGLYYSKLYNYIKFYKYLAIAGFAISLISLFVFSNLFPIEFRIALFLIVGIILISTGFIKTKSK